METLNSPETKSINKFLLIIATVSFYLASTLIKTKERQKIACFFGNICFCVYCICTRNDNDYHFFWFTQSTITTEYYYWKSLLKFAKFSTAFLASSPTWTLNCNFKCLSWNRIKRIEPAITMRAIVSSFMGGGTSARLSKIVVFVAPTSFRTTHVYFPKSTSLILLKKESLWRCTEQQCLRGSQPLDTMLAL